MNYAELYEQQRANNAMNAIAPVGQTISQTSPVDQAVGDLGRRVDDLQKQIECLFNRLRPVLENQDRTGAEPTPPRPQSAVPLVAVLVGIGDRIGDLATMTEYVNQRLAL